MKIKDLVSFICARFIIVLLCNILLLGCGSKSFLTDFFTVDRPLSGNQLLLINGYKVTLIGIEDNQATADFLQANVVDRKVRFFFDSKSPMYRISPDDPEKAFYAYVVLDDGTCLNSLLLKNGYSDVPEGQYYLNDSLDAYLRYTQYKVSRHEESSSPSEKRPVTPEDVPHYTHDVKPPPDPMEEMMRISGCEDIMELIRPSVDFTSPVVRNLGVSLASAFQGTFNINQVCEIFRVVRTKWKYVNDPKGVEFFAKASQTIASTQLSGDCDDYAILLYSLITAVGGDARIILAWGPSGGHAFAEVDITNMDSKEVQRAIIGRFNEYEISSIHYQVDPEGNKWLNLDWWAAHPGGKYLDYDTYMIFYPRQNICYSSDQFD
jgi:transglutaminase-like putative cysteine protease